MAKDPVACLWTLSFHVGDAREYNCTLEVYAFTASQARRKLAATIRQVREGKPSIRENSSPWAVKLDEVISQDLALRGPDYEGNDEQEYKCIDEMIQNAYLKRRQWTDVSFVSYPTD